MITRPARGWATAVAVVLAGAGLAGCSGTSTPKPAPSTTSATPTLTPAAALAALAAQGVQARYSATYRVATVPATKPTVIRVYRLPPSLRVDVVSAGTVASLILNSRGAFSCSASGKARTCFTVAGPGKPVPALFDAGLQRVFSTYLQQLATHADRYDVSAVGTTPASGTIPAGTCYAVTARPSSPAPQVATGRYCLADTGVVTEVRYKSGTLRLELLGNAPAASAVQPYARPTPIP